VKVFYLEKMPVMPAGSEGGVHLLTDSDWVEEDGEEARALTVRQQLIQLATKAVGLRFVELGSGSYGGSGGSLIFELDTDVGSFEFYQEDYHGGCRQKLLLELMADPLTYIKTMASSEGGDFAPKGVSQFSCNVMRTFGIELTQASGHRDGDRGSGKACYPFAKWRYFPSAPYHHLLQRAKRYC
jgi:hypothetical protein